MINTKAIRESIDVDQEKTIALLCDEVDRVSKLYGEARNARIAAENSVAQLQMKVKWLQECCIKQEKYVAYLLDALVIRGGE